MPAIQSSAIMPQPPGSFSRRRMGKGFQMSNRRKSRNPNNQAFQLRADINKTWYVTSWPDTSSMTTYCGSFALAHLATSSEASTPTPATQSIAAYVGSEVTQVDLKKVVGPSVAPWSDKIWRAPSQVSKTERSIPTADPYVPGPGLRCPTPRTVAMAKASRGFRCVRSTAEDTSVSGVIRLVEVEDYGLARGVDFVEVIFVEDGLGDQVFFRGPVAEVAVAAAFAAKREVAVHRRISRCFANRTFMKHDANPGHSVFTNQLEREVYINSSGTGTLACARRKILRRPCLRAQGRTGPSFLRVNKSAGATKT